MSSFDKQSFLFDLSDRTEVSISGIKCFLRLSTEELNFKPSTQIWSITEIFGHLNSINKYYVYEILKKILPAKDVDIKNCNGGILGDFVYQKLMPRPDGSLYKVKSPKMYFAQAENLHPMEELNEFIERQNEIYDILQHAVTKDLDNITVGFHYAKMLRFNLCDTFRFIIAHNERHLMQAHHVMEQIPFLQKG